MRQSPPLLVAAALFAATIFSSYASATPLGFGSDWEYTFNDPTSDPNWNTSHGGWATGRAGFGASNTGVVFVAEGLFSPNTLWETSGQSRSLWVRTLVNTRGYVPGSIAWEIVTNGDFDLYANGTSIDVYKDNGAGSYTGKFGGSLTQDDNIIALALGGDVANPYFDMQITGDLLPKGKQGQITFLEDAGEGGDDGVKSLAGDISVPEPGPIALFGFGLLILSFWINRRRAL